MTIHPFLLTCFEMLGQSLASASTLEMQPPYWSPSIIPCFFWSALVRRHFETSSKWRQALVLRARRVERALTESSSMYLDRVLAAQKSDRNRRRFSPCESCMCISYS
jgi:hypothetical protein